MDKMLKEYLQRADDIIGERTPEEIVHDDEVIACLERGIPIEMALASAAKKYPKEALDWNPGNIDDIADHYDYLMEHTQILKKLKNKKQ
jgi:hypothetical protein